MNQAVRLSFARRPSAVPYMVRGMLPVRRPGNLCPPIVASWRAHRPDPAQLRAFREITGLRDGPLLQQARDLAHAILREDPRLATGRYPAVRAALMDRWAGRLGLAQAG